MFIARTAAAQPRTVVVLMGVIAMRPMLNAGYDTRLAAGVITAGGTLGILIPPSVMIIVYAAVAGQSVVKLYAAAMFPGFFLAALYLIYIIGWVLIDPKIAPKLPAEQTRANISPEVQKIADHYAPKYFLALCQALLSPGKVLKKSADSVVITWGYIAKSFVMSLVPILMTVATMGAQQGAPWELWIAFFGGLFITWIVAALVLLGAAFSLIGSLGLLRMPDFFTRLHLHTTKEDRLLAELR